MIACLEEQPPIDAILGSELLKAIQAIVGIRSEHYLSPIQTRNLDAALEICRAQPVDRAHHAVAEPVGCHAELDRHEWVVTPVEKVDFRHLGVDSSSIDMRQNGRDQ